MADEPEILPPVVTAKRPATLALEAIASQPWAITEEYFATMVSIASRENEITPEALEAFRSARAQNSQLTTRRGPVAIISVVGPIFRYADFFTEISGGVTLDAFARELTQQQNDPAVRAILLNWDSPGGQANGIAEAAGMIEEYARTKPIESYVGGQCCSAAYWMATASNKITIDRTAMLGSIGVRLGIRDSSERDAKSGIRNIEIVSSRAPNKRTDFNSDEGRARLLRMADQMEAVFISDVAANRGVSEEEVVMNFGAGGVEIGADAVTAGMADALGSFEAVLARLSNGNGQAATQRRTRTMTTGTTAPAPTTTATTDTPEATAAAQSAAQIEAARVAGETSAKTRIGAIVNSPEGQANPKLANHFAFETDMSAEAAIKALAVQGPVTTTAAAPAPATTAAAPAPAASLPAGERSKDAAGGLALGAMTESGGAPQQKTDAPALSANSVYANRRKVIANASAN